MYVPVVPLALINGADGIGTGWSTSIPNYNPEDIVENLKLMMDGEPMKPMVPWFRGFKGTITPVGQDKFKFSGLVRQTGDNEIEITELPIRMWTQDFKDRLVEILKAEKVPSFIKDYDDYNTHKDVHFIIRMEDKHMQAALAEGLEEKFKLIKSIATTNLVAFDAEGRMTKYATVEDIMKDFYNVRMKFYEKRKAHQLSEMNKDLEKYTNQARFIQMIIDGKLVVAKKKKADLIKELKDKNFKPIAKVEVAFKEGELEPMADNDEENEDSTDTGASSYDYLLGMPIWSLTKERVEKLLRQIGDRELEIDQLIKMSKEAIWRKDLDDFIEEWRFQLEDEKKRQKKVASLGRRASRKLQISAGVAGRKRKAMGDDPDDSDFGGPKASKKTAAPKPIPKPKGGLLSHLEPLAKANQPKPKPPKAAKKAIAEVKPEKTAPDDIWMNFDGAPNSASDVQIAPVFQKAKAAPAASKKAAPRKQVISDDESDDDDNDRVLSKPAAPAAGSRRPRAAASKPVSYGIDLDSDDNGDDVLFDVGKMVKGINGASADTNTRPLFSNSASISRPGSSHGLSKRPSSFAREIDADADDTDYSKLVPSMSKIGPTATAKRAKVSDDGNEDEHEDGSFDEIIPVARTKPAPKPTTRHVPKKISQALAASKPAISKVAAAGAAKKPPAPAAQPKKLQLSPAAKAYAAKQAKATRKVIADDEDSEDDEVQRLANEIMSDNEAEEEVVNTKRPTRRAAATAKGGKGYAIDGESEDEESDGFEFGDDSDDF
ncbi:MAG: hypothetical protein Q9214_006126 [Letrouitia sp. 1 TL-2023]